jgi:hypothetical protein
MPKKKLFFNKLCKNSNNKFNQKRESKRKQKKMHLQANRSKGLEKTFTNNGVESFKKLSLFSLIFHGKIHHEKISLRVLDLNQRFEF